MTSSKRREYALVAVEHRHFQRAMADLSVEDAASVHVRNVTRHSVATYLRSVLPAPVIDDLLGHTGSAIRPTTSESIASPYWRMPFTAAVESLLKQARATSFNDTGVMHAFSE